MMQQFAANQHCWYRGEVEALCTPWCGTPGGAYRITLAEAATA